ncbi:MAG: response regulator [Desulfomonile tiedjei]|uniref:histidine kinase n=1 Tax=Desulfomonile tiedjei TaxID=2358 RepID=A0A9D6V3V9_9BACT|nr:response regulator [Desulfomonile tiedjei]
MSCTEIPAFDFDVENVSIPNLSGKMTKGTQTIDLSLLLSDDLTSSGSFDLRRVQFATFGSLVQSLSVPTLLIERTHKVEFANNAFKSMTQGFDPVGLEFSRVFQNPSQARDFELRVERVFKERRPEVLEKRLRIQDKEIWGRVHLRTLRLGAERLVLVQIENLTAQKELDTIQKYKKLVEIFPIGIAEFIPRWPAPSGPSVEQIIDIILRARLIDGNTQYAKMCGRNDIKELAGLHFGKLLPAKRRSIELCQSWIRKGFAALSFETRETRPSEITMHFENTLIGNLRDGHLIGLWWMKRDVSDKKKTEEEILRAQKLESLGVLAGGIAHDFNNLLTAILGNIALGQSRSKLSDQSSEKFEAAVKATNLAQGLTRQLLTFSKGGAPIKSTSDLAELLKQCAGFVMRGSNVDCKFSVPGNLWPVEMDEGQISQVINNLIINALEAMPQGGTILIKASNVHAEKEHGLPLKEGSYVKVTIADQGGGIDKAHIAKIFDPYFTTKEKGTGLGLATSYSIVKKHGGLMTVRSKAGLGSTFYFFLPASATALAPDTTAVTELVTGIGRVLVMDDDKMIRDTTGELVRELGYDVEVARDGAEAIDAYKKALSEGRQFDVVILDLTIPGGMGGRDTLVMLQAIDPNVKAIVSSGYSDDSVMAEHSTLGFKAVLAKPYNAQKLGQTIATVTGSGNPANRDTKKNGS